MPVTSNTWTYGGFPCVDPRSLLEAGNRSQISQAFLGKANSYRCPQGRAWGTGYVLLYGRDVATMFAESKKAPRSLVISIQRSGEADSSNNVTTTLTIQSLFPLRAINLTPMIGTNGNSPWKDRKETQNTSARFWNNTRPINPACVYLLELVDRRYFLARFTALNKNYNVPHPIKSAGFDGYEATAANFYEDSLTSGSFWTSKIILEDIWTEMGSNLTGGSLTFNPTTFPTTGGSAYTRPLNFRFNGVNAWESFHDVLDTIGVGNTSAAFTLVYNPVLDTFTVLSETLALSLTQPELVNEDTLTYLESIRLYDTEVIETGIGVIPKTARYYRKRRFPKGGSPNFDVKTGVEWSYPVNVLNEIDLSITTPTTFDQLEALDDTVEFIHSGPPIEVTLETPDTDDPIEATESYVGNSSADGTGLRTDIGRRTYNEKYGFVAYRGLATTHENEIILPKTEIRQSVWRDYGDELGLVTEFHAYEGNGPAETSRNELAFSSREIGRGLGSSFPSGYGNFFSGYSAGSNNTRHVAPDFNRFDWRDEVPETAIVRSLIAYPIDYAGTGTADDQTKSFVSIGSNGAVGVVVHAGRQFSPDTDYHGPKCYIKAHRGWSFSKPDPTNSDILARSVYNDAVFVPPNREFVGKLIGIASDGVPIYEVTVFAEIFELVLEETLDVGGVSKANLTLDSGTGGASTSFVYVSGAYLPRYPTTMSTALSGGDAHSHTIDTPYPLAIGTTVAAFLNYRKIVTVGFNTAYLHAFSYIP